MERACILNRAIRVDLDEISTLESIIGSDDKNALRPLDTAQTRQLQKILMSLKTPTSQGEELIASSHEEALQVPNCLYFVVTKSFIFYLSVPEASKSQ